MQKRTEKTKSTLKRNDKDTESVFLVHTRNRLCRWSETLPRGTGGMRSREKGHGENKGLGCSESQRNAREHKPEAAGTLGKQRRDPEDTCLFRVHRRLFGWSLGAAEDTGKYSLSETVFSPDEKSTGNTQSFVSNVEQTGIVFRKKLCCQGICLQHTHSRPSPPCLKGCESPLVDTCGEIEGNVRGENKCQNGWKPAQCTGARTEHRRHSRKEALRHGRLPSVYVHSLLFLGLGKAAGNTGEVLALLNDIFVSCEGDRQKGSESYTAVQRREGKTSAVLRKRNGNLGDVPVLGSEPTFSGCIGEAASLPTVDRCGEIEGSVHREKLGRLKTLHNTQKRTLDTPSTLGRRFEGVFLVRPRIGFSVVSKPAYNTGVSTPLGSSTPNYLGIFLKKSTGKHLPSETTFRSM
ncbi:MAG: uncharacterized protein A8A55_2394 [Amphiamblys sp. WSBS2006]|nr:MAG: uncharacterized protein A8A55_2394 [Amphiamblys sp. WSBS2006]